MSIYTFMFFFYKYLFFYFCSIDPEKLTGYSKFTFTKPINLVGSYTAKGKVQVLPINGKGQCNITLSKLDYFELVI